MGEMSESTQAVWKSFLNGKATVKDVHNAVINDLSSMEDQTKANELGVAFTELNLKIWKQMLFIHLVTLQVKLKT